MKVIPFRTLAPMYLTTREFEELNREVLARCLMGDATLGDKILAKMLIENSARYRELVLVEVAGE
jgi:hypothetical protein